MIATLVVFCNVENLEWCTMIATLVGFLPLTCKMIGHVSWFSLARVPGEHAGLGGPSGSHVSTVKFENAQLR